MKILVGLSGGIDSATTAFLLQQMGHEVVGATMQIINNDMKSQFQDTNVKGCFSLHEAGDVKDATKLANKLGIAYHLIDCRDEFTRLVLNNFKNEYNRARTPNPCVLCNTLIKFDILPKSAQKQGIIFDKFATGHYAQIIYDEKTTRYQLKMAKDIKKDQSYFLYRLTQEQLSKIIMPLGQYFKEDVRDIAQKAGIEIAQKSESQDFYTGDLNDILQNPPKQGTFIDTAGKILGHHTGSWRYTIGQRKGLGVSAPTPLYVLDINPIKNEVILGQITDCAKNALIANDVTWCSIPPINTPIECTAKIRSSQKPTPVTLIPCDSPKTIEVYFKIPQNAIAPGQSVVFYNNDLVLGGGFIEKSFNIK